MMSDESPGASHQDLRVSVHVRSPESIELNNVRKKARGVSADRDPTEMKRYKELLVRACKRGAGSEAGSRAMLAMTGISRYDSSSAGEWNEGSIRSRTYTATRPMTPEKSPAISAYKKGECAGSTGAVGCSAMATLTTLFWSRASVIRASSRLFTYRR